jgi:hypothetical protein
MVHRSWGRAFKATSPCSWRESAVVSPALGWYLGSRRLDGGEPSAAPGCGHSGRDAAAREGTPQSCRAAGPARGLCEVLAAGDGIWPAQGGGAAAPLAAGRGSWGRHRIPLPIAVEPGRGGGRGGPPGLAPRACAAAGESGDGTGHRGARSAQEGPPLDGCRGGLVRCRLRTPTERPAARVVGRQETPGAEVVRGVGTRWSRASGVAATTGEGGSRLRQGGAGQGGSTSAPRQAGVPRVDGQVGVDPRRGGMTTRLSPTQELNALTALTAHRSLPSCCAPLRFGGCLALGSSGTADGPPYSGVVAVTLQATDRRPVIHYTHREVWARAWAV